jgi:hypothetical protein
MINLDINPIFSLICWEVCINEIVNALLITTNKKWICRRITALNNRDTKYILFLEEIYFQNEEIYKQAIALLQNFHTRKFFPPLKINTPIIDIFTYGKIIDYLTSNDIRSLKKIFILQ